jgi:hypothetical protein
MASRERWRVAQSSLGLMLLLLLCGSSCGQKRGSVNAEAEAQFRDLLDSASTTELVVFTDKQRYHRNDIIDFWVENGTSQTIWFEDQSFGVRAVTYDEASKQWVPVELGFRASQPMARSIESGGGGVLEYYTLLADRIDVPEDGKIRLVITGHTDLTNPAVDRLYVAYTDVEVVE